MDLASFLCGVGATLLIIVAVLVGWVLVDLRQMGDGYREYHQP